MCNLQKKITRCPGERLGAGQKVQKGLQGDWAALNPWPFVEFSSHTKQRQSPTAIGAKTPSCLLCLLGLSICGAGEETRAELWKVDRSLLPPDPGKQPLHREGYKPNSCAWGLGDRKPLKPRIRHWYKAGSATPGEGQETSSHPSPRPRPRVKEESRGVQECREHLPLRKILQDLPKNEAEAGQLIKPLHLH